MILRPSQGMRMTDCLGQRDLKEHMTAAVALPAGLMGKYFECWCPGDIILSGRNRWNEAGAHLLAALEELLCYFNKKHHENTGKHY